MSRAIAATFGLFGALLGCGGLFLGGAVVAVALQKFPNFDYLTAGIALVMLVLAALAFAEAWRRWRAAP
ncbi:MAG TPA: hypothetical protein VFM93_00285 [Candidatus Limnocylindria bacterium]|nr:hypothetical protein [Candidatus Limnocylindria bacterium]